MNNLDIEKPAQSPGKRRFASSTGANDKDFLHTGDRAICRPYLMRA